MIHVYAFTLVLLFYHIEESSDRASLFWPRYESTEACVVIESSSKEPEISCCVVPKLV
jgi:hypothetical protein